MRLRDLVTDPCVRRRASSALAALIVALPCLALATPPSWAPAHGWRKKNDPHYAGYSGRSWDDDFGVQSGRCNREDVGAVLGAVAGGAIGAEAGPDGAGRAVAVVVGTVIGAAIGAEIGRRMDKADRSCAGHALELARGGQTVTWVNPTSGVTWQLTPVSAPASTDGCRKFRLIATGSFGLGEGRTTACPGEDGVWNLAPEAKMSRR
jgi:surface antigen